MRAIEAHAQLLMGQLGQLALPGARGRAGVLGLQRPLVLETAGGHANQQGHLGDTRYLKAAPEGHAGLQSVHEVTAGL